MATTKITDVVVPENFAPYVVQRTTELSELIAGGIMQRDASLDGMIAGGGKTFNMPFWNDLDGDSDVISDDDTTDATPAKLTSGQDEAVRHLRHKAWSNMTLAGVLAGDAPEERLGDLIAGYWVRNMQGILISSLTGVIADNDANDDDDMIFDISNDDAGDVTADEKVSSDAIIAARQTMGDAGQNLTAIAMHSVVKAELDRQEAIEYVRPAGVPFDMPTYKGLAVIVDDGCPAVSGSNRVTYTSYLFGAGAVGYGEALYGNDPMDAVEIDRKPASGNGGGQTILHSRRQFILHPRGIRFTSGSVAGQAPTNSELEDAGNWDRAYDRKAVRIAVLKTNG